MITYNNERCIIFDESGNLGNSGRYFVIACIDTYDYKGLHNMMKNKLKKAKNMFPELANIHSNEIKAKDAYPCVKYHIFECLSKKELKISYIVADLKHVKPNLLKDKNIFYNYLMKLLLDSMIGDNDCGKKVNIICDNKTTKVASANSFEEYIKLHFLYEKEYDLGLNIVFMDSDSKSAYTVQAADYVANALYSLFEYKNDIYCKQFQNEIQHHYKFPLSIFGK